MDARCIEILKNTASDLTYLVYKVRELEAFIDSERRYLIESERLLETMYLLDRISDKINDHLGELEQRTLN